MIEQFRRAARAILDFYAVRQYLHRRSAERHDAGLREALQASRQLRWQGAALVGELMPAPADQPRPDQPIS